MYNRLQKLAVQSVTAVPTQLTEQTSHYDLTVEGLDVSDKQLQEVRSNEDLIDTTEVQLEGIRSASDGELGIEKNLTANASSRNNSNEGLTVKPLDILNHAFQEERDAAFKKSQTSRDTDYWDNRIGVGKQIISRMGPSQLQDNPDRFSNLTVNPKEIGEAEVKEMVTASLHETDAMLLSLYLTAAKESRGLTPTDVAAVEELNEYKFRLLTAQAIARPSLDHIAARIEKLDMLLEHTPVNSPDYDRIKDELEQLIEHGRGNTQGMGGNDNMATPTLQPFTV